MTHFQEHIDNARSAMAEEQFENAVKSISAALLLDASNAEALQLASELGELEEKARLDNIERIQQLNSKRTMNDTKPDDHHLKAHRYFLERHFDLAMAEVTLALLTNPFDVETQKLEKQIQDALAREGTEDAVAPSPLVNSILLVTKRYIEREKLDEALAEVTAGLAIDAKHPELLWLRSSILEQKQIKKARERQARKNDAILNIREQFARTEFDKALNAVQYALVEFPDDTEIVAVKAEIESAYSRWQELKRFEGHTATVNEHIRNARQLLRSDRVDEATSEIALGLVLDPYNQELKRLEKELWDAHARLEEVRVREETERRKTQELVKLKLFLLAAEEFAKHGEFSRALDEIVQAYLIDPTDVEAKRLETRVRQLQQRSGASPLKLVYKNQQAAQA